jgi:hypothetical protein
MRLSRRAAAAGLVGLAAAAPRAAWADPLDIRGAEVLPGRRDLTSRMTTRVSVNGMGPYAFVVDTGANRSVMSAELAAQLNLPAGRPTKVHGILGLQDALTVNAQSFTAGRIRLPILDIPTLRREDLGCDGFLGLDAFRDRSVGFDFRNNRVAIMAAGFDDIDPGDPSATLTSDVIIRARQKYGQLTIAEAEAAGRRIGCFIDSGAQVSVGNMAMRQMVKSHTGDRAFTPIRVVLYGATGQQTHGEVAEVDTLGVGLLRFTGFRMAFADLHTFSLWGMQDRPAMMMGMDLLSLFELVTVDFRQNFVRFRMAEAINLESRS